MTATSRPRVTLGDGKSYTGARHRCRHAETPVVLAKDAGLRQRRPGQPGCSARPGTLDPAKADRQDRGLRPRRQRPRRQEPAGEERRRCRHDPGEHRPPSTLDSDLHSVPTVHLDDTAAPAVKAYVGGTTQPDRDDQPPVRRSASTRRRWPAPPAAARPSAGNGDLLKPDIMAPGTTCWPRPTAFSAAGGEYAFISGTSMSSAAHRRYRRGAEGQAPDLVPDGDQVGDDDDRHRQGHQRQADPERLRLAGATRSGTAPAKCSRSSAMDPGLVYDSTYTDWTKFVCGSGQVPSTHELCANGKIDLERPELPDDRDRRPGRQADRDPDRDERRQAPGGLLPEGRGPQGPQGDRDAADPDHAPGPQHDVQGHDREQRRSARAVRVRPPGVEVGRSTPWPARWRSSR